MRKLIAAAIVAIALVLSAAPTVALACIPEDPGINFC
jgi:hypothetical protein